MTSRYKALIFDMDGTLLDSMRVWRTMWREYIEEHNLPMPEELKDQVIFPCGRAAKYIARDAGLNAADVVREMIEVNLLRHYLTDVKPKPCVIETLEKMRAAGIRLALATATPLKCALPALEKHDMLRFFPDTFDTEIIGHVKSEAAFFEDVAGALGLMATDCVMFEDALYAMRGVKAAGMGLVAIEDEMARQDRDEIRAAADRYCTSWRELYDDDSWRSVLIRREG